MENKIMHDGEVKPLQSPMSLAEAHHMQSKFGKVYGYLTLSLRDFILGNESDVYVELADRLVDDGSNNLKNIEATLTGTYHKTAAVARVEAELR